MAKTSTDAKRHIREWSRFFKDIAEFTEEAINNFLKDHRKRKYLKQSLKRLLNKGFLVKKNNKISFTLRGQRFFKQNFGRNIIVDWDSKWRLISFDVPGNYNIKRDRLRALLRGFDFYPLHKSVWISPASLSDDFWKLAVENELDKYCKVMIVEILEGEKEYKKYFGIKD